MDWKRARTYLPLGIVAFYYDHDERLESYYSFRKTTRRNIKKAQQRPQAVLISLVVLRCQFRSFGRKSPFPLGYGPLYRNDDDMTDDYYSRIKYA